MARGSSSSPRHLSEATVPLSERGYSSSLTDVDVKRARERKKYKYENYLQIFPNIWEANETIRQSDVQITYTRRRKLKLKIEPHRPRCRRSSRRGAESLERIIARVEADPRATWFRSSKQDFLLVRYEERKREGEISWSRQKLVPPSPLSLFPPDKLYSRGQHRRLVSGRTTTSNQLDNRINENARAYRHGIYSILLVRRGAADNSTFITAGENRIYGPRVNIWSRTADFLAVFSLSLSLSLSPSLPLDNS